MTLAARIGAMQVKPIGFLALWNSWRTVSTSGMTVHSTPLEAKSELEQSGTSNDENDFYSQCNKVFIDMLHFKLKAFVKLFHTKLSQKQIQTGARKPSEQTFRAALKNLKTSA